jgi:hypothetical protein
MAQPDIEVRSLLEGRLAAMPGLPALVEYENRALPTSPDPDEDTWLRSRVLFGSQVAHSINGQGAQGLYDNGAYVVTIFVPQDVGPDALDALAVAVRSWFKPQRLNGANVSIVLGNSSRGPGLEPPQGEPPFYYCAVTIALRAYYSL